MKQNFVVTTTTSTPSHPAWVCGLKPRGVVAPVGHLMVTPCVGVWIETKPYIYYYYYYYVTPCVGVWIET